MGQKDFTVYSAVETTLRKENMSKPIRCSTCHELVGTYTYPLFAKRSYNGACPGTGNHQKPIRKEKYDFFKRKKEVTLFYPETNTVSHWVELRQKDGTYQFLHSL
jgi:hypothetical protein